MQDKILRQGLYKINNVVISYRYWTSGIKEYKEYGNRFAQWKVFDGIPATANIIA